MRPWLTNGLRKTSSEIYYEVGHQLVNLGIRRASRDYTKFILLGRPRSGTNLLITTLEQHPALLAYGELLQQSTVRWNRKMGLERRHWIEHAYDEPQEYLTNVVFRDYPTKIKAVGFKLFYHHARKKPQKKVWQFLREDRDLHVIHLRRRNLLKIVLSRKLADRSGVWRLLGPQASELTDISDHPRPIYLDYDDLQRRFTRMKAVEERRGAYYSGHPQLNLWYEDLAGEFAAQTRLVQEFLELDPRPLQPMIRKQAKRPLDEQIENYAELKKRFAGSEWVGFFES